MAIIIFLWIKRNTQKEKLRIKPVIQIKTSTNVSYDRVSCHTNRGNIKDGCYVEIGKKCETDNNQNSSNVATNLSSMDDDKNDLQDIDQLYAVVDNSAKVRKPLQVDANEDSHASDMLSIVNYKDMKFEFEDVTDLYAVVDKSAKKRKAKEDLPEELYAVVDEANKKEISV